MDKLKVLKKLKMLRILIPVFLVVFAVTSLMGVKYREFGRRFLNIGKYYKGDLFDMTRLWRFEEEIVPNWDGYENEGLDIKDAEIITMGDSFFEANYETPPVAYQLQQLTGKNVYNVDRKDFKAAGDNPLVYLDTINYQKGKAKYLVLEVVERYALDTSTRYQYTNYKDFAKFSGLVLQSDTKAKTEYTRGIKSFIDTPNLQYFFYNNRLVAPIYEIGKNFRFEVLGEIDKRTPIYTDNPSMLFYYEDVDFNKTNTEKKYVDMMAFNISLLGKTLKEKYDLELIYVIMPTKYTIYGKYHPDFKGYNGFIPSVLDSLQKLNVNTFDTYSLYTTALDINKDLLYYSGDTHFTPRGKKLIVNEIIRLLKQLGGM
jgi:hypothetical protein